MKAIIVISALLVSQMSFALNCNISVAKELQDDRVVNSQIVLNQTCTEVTYSLSKQAAKDSDGSGPLSTVNILINKKISNTASELTVGLDVSFMNGHGSTTSMPAVISFYPGGDTALRF